MKLASIAVLVFSSLAAATPTATETLEKRGTFCGQWDSVETGAYTVYNNLWGESSGSGSQCTTVSGLSGSSVKWSTSWSWSGGQGHVKSYANAVLHFTAAKLSSISKIPTTWSWGYTGNNLVADVAYDMFTSSSCGGSASYEIMVWLAALGGAGPISSTGSPVATPTINGVTWKLYKGPNGSTTVFSFVAESKQTSFNGDLKQFFNYLTANQGVSTSQCLYSIGAGTEPFSGSSAVLTSTYSASVQA